MNAFACFLWDGREHRNPERQIAYGGRHVQALRRMLIRTQSEPFRLFCVTDRPAAELEPGACCIPLPSEVAILPSFYPKLWAYSDAFAKALYGAGWSGRVLLLDLDVIIVGDLSPLFSRSESFIIWDQANGELYNTSAVMMQPAVRARVWNEFDLHEARAREAQMKTKSQRFIADQGWLASVLGQGQPTFSECDGLLQYRPSKHKDEPQPGGLAYFMCGPYDPATEQSAWIREAWDA